jgi:hypothetical protein
MTNAIPPKGKVELKVKAATLTTFLLSLAATTLLATTATDYVHVLPDWAEAPAYSFLLALGTYIAGYMKRSQPENLSASTIEAVRAWMAKHAPRKPTA